MNLNKRVHLAMAGSALVYGANYTIAKSLIPAHMTAPAFVLLRVLIGAVVFWVLGRALFPGQEVARKDLPYVFMLALLVIVINQLCFFQGLSMTRPTNASVIVLTIPILIFLFSALAGKERFTLLKALGVALGLTGAFILIYKPDFSLSQDTVQGDLLVFVNAVSFASYVVLSVKMVRKYNPFVILKWVFLLGFVCLIPFGLEDAAQVSFVHLPTEAKLALLYNVVFSVVYIYSVNAWVPSVANPSVVGVYVYFHPIVATTFAILVGADSFRWELLIVFVLVASGVFLVSKKPAK